MHAAALIAALLFAASGAAPLPAVQDDVELISVANLPESSQIMFFWGTVQSEFVVIDQRWTTSEMTPFWRDGAWHVCWQDNGDDCYRIVRAPIYVESFEATDPRRDERGNAPWWRQQCQTGLKQPPKLAGAGEAR